MRDLVHQESKKIKAFLFGISLTNEPFVALYALAPFILRKELEASLLQLAILTSLRPVIPVIAFYWSARLDRQKHRLRSNFILAWILARIPFLFLLVFPNSWYFVFCCAMYELFKKSGTPAFVEILKVNMQDRDREKNYCLCFLLTFVESVLIGLVITKILNGQYFIWKDLFVITSMISLLGLFMQFRVPSSNLKDSNRKNVLHTLMDPWKKAFYLLKENERFLYFQYGFMIGGTGLMLVAPALSIFYVDRLHLSSAEIAIARSVCMGIGVIFSTYFWERLILQRKVEEMLKNILLGFFLYLILSYFSLFGLAFFYISNFVYGIAQAGSHLLWNLSGPIFSGPKESTQFTNVNVLMVGLRGAIVPATGSIICTLFGPAPTFLIGAGICVIGCLYMAKVKRYLLAIPSHTSSGIIRN